jgi:hypothetical protein
MLAALAIATLTLAGGPSPPAQAAGAAAEAVAPNPAGSVALVVEDPTTLRNAPRTDAAGQATLWRGDWLEVRGETAGFLKVYDHRRERPGYVRPTQVRIYRLDESVAPELRAIVRFLRDSAGSESLGIAYAALALKAAPAGAEPTEMLAAIGTMADRLARRASGRRDAAKDAMLAGELEVAASYGIKLEVVEGEPAWTGLGGTQLRPPRGVGGTPARSRLCYDGEAWAGVLASPAATPTDRARAALFFAEACGSVGSSPAAERERNDRRIAALATLDFAAERALPAALVGRVRLRRAEAFAWRAFDEARRGNADAGARAEATAVRELALCDRVALAPEDFDLYEQVAIEVAASRFATDAAAVSPGRRPAEVAFEPRAPGETCVRVQVRSPRESHLAVERCSYGVVWQSSLRWAPSGTLATLAVQPLAAWTELWVLRRAGDGTWSIETLTPATADPEITVGYVESAGFSPDGRRLLVVRESRAAGRPSRRFQVLAAATLAVEHWSPSAEQLGAFKRWSAPSWRAGTLALR